MNKFRIHLLALPNAGLTKSFSLDGFSQCSMRFCRLLMDLGHHVYLYGPEPSECDVPCTELITVMTAEERDSLLSITLNEHTGLPDPTPYQYAYHESWSPIYQLANARIIREIGKRKQPRDFICSIGGSSQKPVADAHPDLMFVEYSIGYQGSFSPYRVFESTAWRHFCYGQQGIGDGRSFDTVIPCPFDPDEFPFSATKDPFILYAGRFINRKGIAAVVKTAEASGLPLKVIGHGGTDWIPATAEHLGAVSPDERNYWMSRAQCVMTPTIYIEPFNQVAVEAQLCGTPVISTDWGGFTETIEHGRTGYRCNYLGEFVQAVHDSAALDPHYIRRRAVAKYSLSAIAPQYQSYFERLSLLWDKGWDTADMPTSMPTSSLSPSPEDTFTCAVS